jgi:molecular chaperone DnaK
MKRLVCLLLVACSQNDEPPKLAAPQANLMGTVAHGVYAGSAKPSAPSGGATQNGAAKPPAPSGGATQKLFADDVATGVLPLTIGIETIGDVATPLFRRGTALPVTHTEVFSTALDDQNRVEVHVLQGERPLASQNRSLGKFQLFGIPPAPRGVPQIEVTFAIDRDGVLTVSARDKATGQSKQVTIEGAAGAALDKAAVDKLLAEAQAAKADDDIRRDWAQAKNDLDQMIYSSKSLLAATSTKLSKKMHARLEKEIAAADAVLKISTKPESPALLRGVIESLRQTTHAASEELYKHAP